MKFKKALIIVDPQNDFISGSLTVPGALDVLPIINNIDKSKFDIVIITQDYHPNNHKSFASQHKDKKEFDVIKLNDIEQVLWPDHCVQGTDGSNFHKDLDLNIENLYVFKKGTNPEYDSYSGFQDANNESTGLHDFLQEHDINDVFICGFATDYCVKYTAKDSIDLGYNTILLADACESIDEDSNKHYIEMANEGILIADTQDIK